MASEKRLIDADELKCHKFCCADANDAYRHGWNNAIDAITENAPTVDAVEVVHARWEDGYSVDFKGGIVYTSIDCSNCNEIFKTDDREYWKKRFKSCPFCGALMDGERKDNE